MGLFGFLRGGAFLLVALILLLFIFPKQVAWVLGTFLLIVLLGAILFYIRVKLALRRFKRAVAAAVEGHLAARGRVGSEAGRPSGPAGAPQGRGEVLDAEFRVEDDGSRRP